MKIFWLTGQPGAGKTEIAKAILRKHDDWFNVDGDDIRDIFDNKDYSKQGRYQNIKLAQSISEFLYLKDKYVVVSLVSPYRELREEFKEKIGDDLVEIYVHTTEDRGKNKYHVEGYEEPLENFIDLDTTNRTVEQSLEALNQIIFLY